MDWIKTKDALPEQGKKVICIIDNIPVIALRLKDIWLPFPFLDSQYGCFKDPDWWCYIELPDGLLGSHKIFYDGKIISMDEFSNEQPKAFDKYVGAFMEKFGPLCKNWDKPMEDATKQTPAWVRVVNRKSRDSLSKKYYVK